MCGIAVAVDWEDAQGVVEAMIRKLRHRGLVSDPIVAPWPNVATGTRRLPIVDPDGGEQPKLSFDGRVLLAFNGEIYNHEALRRELQALGVMFKTQSDTEVFANALSLWGSRALRKVIGIYAFVALDLLKKDYLAGRDPMGVKPLYLIQADRGVLFCSEIKPLLEATPVGDVMLLPPGHILSKKGCFRLQWEPSDDEAATGDVSAATLDQLLSSAVARRVPPQTPMALMFSGGIDSTLVAHYARRLRPDAPAYFLGTSDAPDYPFAARYAQMTDLDFQQIAIDLDLTIDLVRAAVSSSESYEPDVVRNCHSTALISQKISQDGYLVALSGEGADELFAGYRPLEASFAADEAIGRNLREQYLEMMHRSNLQRLDRGGMRHQVEIREPFLDASIIRYARQVPGARLMWGDPSDLCGKAPLRELYNLYPDQLPTMIRDRRKVPLSTGAGIEGGNKGTPWQDFAEAFVSDADFKAGRRQFPEFDITTKEEHLYLTLLNDTFDVRRTPHLTLRHRLAIPHFQGWEQAVD